MESIITSVEYNGDYNMINNTYLFVDCISIKTDGIYFECSHCQTDLCCHGLVVEHKMYPTTDMLKEEAKQLQDKLNILNDQINGIDHMRSDLKYKSYMEIPNSYEFQIENCKSKIENSIKKKHLRKWNYKLFKAQQKLIDCCPHRFNNYSKNPECCRLGCGFKKI